MARYLKYEISEGDVGMLNGILINKLDIENESDLEDAETLLFKDTVEYYFIKVQEEDLVFDIALLYNMHEHFLSTLYEWAGKTRTVNFGKGGTLFAPIQHIENSLSVTDDLIRDRSLSVNDSIEEIAKNAAVIHNELNFLHPFRDGNGRTIRLFVNLMIWDQGYKEVDWDENEGYLDACIAGISANHKPMEEIIFAGLELREE